ncbi:hypothetical protein, partial [Stenotrophomonas muris]|uniref:hypothetical protein n=1 Tax=Stenotrophomonas muris TaxID=2963283 RepID=UPI00383B4EC4
MTAWQHPRNAPRLAGSGGRPPANPSVLFKITWRPAAGPNSQTSFLEKYQSLLQFLPRFHHETGVAHYRLSEPS